ncbi:MAG: glycerol-3-phosphate 1-O-acyltransferase PlsY [Microvirga sp.]
MPESMNWSLAAPYFAAAFAIGYLFGSIPFGLLLTRFAGLGDIRRLGSGNIGATNVLRTGRKGLAAATLVGDALKGTAAVLLMGWLWGPNAAVLAGLGAFLGHLFPVWLGFKGGKGVATYVGCLLGLKPVAVVAFGAIWLATAAVSRYSSLSGLVASAAMPPVLWWLGERQMAELFVILTALLWWRHRENIRRLAAGSESRIGKSVDKSVGKSA